MRGQPDLRYLNIIAYTTPIINFATNQKFTHKHTHTHTHAHSDAQDPPPPHRTTHTHTPCDALKLMTIAQPKRIRAVCLSNAKPATILHMFIAFALGRSRSPRYNK